MIADTEWSNLRYELERSSSISNIKKISAWMALDCPEPPPSAYKQELIKKYFANFGTTNFVETGTYHGEMVNALKPFFQNIYSVELSNELFMKAKKQFIKDRNVHLYQGDSGEVLPKILKKLSSPAIFWLDAHYSQGETAKGDLDTPIVKELEAIISHKIKGHVILIDDARLFTGNNDYPTIKSLKKFASSFSDSAIMRVRHDIIRIHNQLDDIEV